MIQYVGMIVENTMVKDFAQFNYKPLILLSCTTMSISCFSYVSVSALITVLSACLKLLITFTHSLITPFPLINVSHDHLFIRGK